MAEQEDAPEDDLSVAAATRLFRRVSPEHYKRVDGEFVVREGAFKNFPRPELKRMSVVLGDALDAAMRAPETVLQPGQDKFGVVALTAAQVRDEEQRIERSEQEDEPAHGDVYGEKTAGRRKRFARMAEWVVYPTVFED